MIGRGVLVALLFGVAAIPAQADSIDDAEAKRRGVPVAQVLAERAQALEKQKALALEKQKRTAATVPATVATTGSVLRPINFDGPREDSPVYNDLVDRYLGGDWATLATDLAKKEAEIAKLPAGNRADLTYIKQVIAECRPTWWAQAKSGKDTQFKQTIWNNPVGISFKSAERPGLSKIVRVNGALMSGVSWPADDMDSREPMSMMYLMIGTNDQSNFVRSDGVTYMIWTMMGIAQVIQQSADKGGKLTPEETQQLEVFAEFRANLTCAYYGTPPARRLALIQSATAMQGDALHAAELYAHRPLAAAFLIEMRAHREQYKSLHLSDHAFTWTPNAEGAESNAADRLINKKLLNTRLTLTEDRLLRDMIKALADANQDWKSTRVQLPYKLSMEFEPEKDGATRMERMSFAGTDSNPSKGN